LFATEKTFFKQFCAGESLAASKPVLQKLSRNGISTILDYAVETATDEAALDDFETHVLETIELASSEKAITFSCVKVSGLCEPEVMEAVSDVLADDWQLKYRVDPAWSSSDIAAAVSSIAQRHGKLLLPIHVQKFARAIDRLDRICARASAKGLSLLVDAEQSWFQPMIDLTTLLMEARYNNKRACVWNTYQMYLRDGLTRLKADAAAADGRFVFGAKLVRGAYMLAESTCAAERQQRNPVHANISATHRAYDSAVELLLDRPSASLMVASHNAQSLLRTTQLMRDRRISPNDPRVNFAQLYGMADHLTYGLASRDFRACKYVPFGPVAEVVPYLLRRVHENSGMLGRAAEERHLLAAELRRRLISLPKNVFK